MKNIFRYQVWHLMAAGILLAAMRMFLTANLDIMTEQLWGVSSVTWFWLAVAVPVVHQLYVLLAWRLELYYNLFTARLGLKKAFRIYATGFSILFTGRLVSIIIVAWSDRNTLAIPPLSAYLTAGALLPVVLYLFYSVKKYFGIERAFGIDHFDKSYNKAYEKRGIFRYTDNGMYVFGLMILYLPGLLLLSKAALAVALFNHIFIWAHYYCTELPDMKEIYGSPPEKSGSVSQQ